MINIIYYDLIILVGRNDQCPMGGCETAVRIEWYKVHGGKKDSNIWKETSQKQKAGLEKEGALKKGSGRAWFNRGRLSQIKREFEVDSLFYFMSLIQFSTASKTSKTDACLPL